MNAESQLQDNNALYLSAALEWVRLRLERQIQHLQDSATQASSEQEGKTSKMPNHSRIERETARTASTMADAEKQTEKPTLIMLSNLLGLSRLEREVLLLCVAMELDTRIADLCALAQNNPHARYPTFALALSLFDEPDGNVMSPERPLRFWHLVEVLQSGDQNLAASPLRADEWIVDYVKGSVDNLDSQLIPLTAPLEVDMHEAELPPSRQSIVEQIAKQWQQATNQVPCVQLVGPNGPEKQLIAHHAATLIRKQLYRIPIEMLPTQGAQLELVARLWSRQSLLLPISLYLDAQELVGTATIEEHGQVLSRFLALSDGIFFLGVREVWPGLTRANIVFHVDEPSADEKQIVTEVRMEDSSESADDVQAEFLPSKGIESMNVSSGESLRGSSFERPVTPRQFDEPIEIFYSYAPRDEALQDELSKHLISLRRQMLIREWYRYELYAGQELEIERMRHLNSAHLILLLISADYLASDYLYEVEMKRALERYAAGEARVIPIILRATDWESAPFAQLPVLPGSGTPVTSLPDSDTALYDVAEGIRQAVMELRGNLTAIPPLSGTPSISPVPTTPFEVFLSYAHKDEELHDELLTHLSLLRRQGFITLQNSGSIRAGQEWEEEITAYLKRARLILLLVSADYLASDYLYEVEMKRALERYAAGEARVIPIILRATDWYQAPFSRLPVLPANSRPVTNWSNRDEALTDVAKGIRRAVETLNADIMASSSLASDTRLGPEVPAPARPLEVYYSYSRRDAEFRDELSIQLSLLKRRGLITEWYDRMIQPGVSWEEEIQAHINTADIILLLVSTNFLSSNYAYEVEMRRALERHAAGEARVIPIILRPVYWQSEPFGQLFSLPSDGRPVSRWESRDAAFLDIAQNIQKVVEELIATRPIKPISQAEALAHIRLIKGDLFNLRVDALVHPTSPALDFTGQIGQQLRELLSPEVYERLREGPSPGLGEAIESDVGSLPARYLLHTPVREAGQKATVTTVVSGVLAALARAEDLPDVRTVAFPSVGTGVEGLSPAAVMPAVLTSVMEHLERGSRLESVRFVFMDDAAYQAATDAYRQLGGRIEVVQQAVVNYSLEINIASDQLMVGERVKLQVALRPPSASSKGMLVTVPVDIAEVYCKVSADGLRVNMPDLAPLSLNPYTGELAIVTFELEAHLHGRRSCTIELFIEDPQSQHLTISRTSLSLTVAPPKVGAERPPLLPILDIHIAPLPDFIMEVDSKVADTNSDIHALTYYLTSRLPFLQLEHQKVGAVILSTTELAQIRIVIREMVQQATDMQPEDAYAHMISLGTYLFDRLFPAEDAADFRSAYWQVADQLTTWLVIEDGIVEDRVTWLPWELVAPYRAEDTTFPRFLGERYHLSRWIEGFGSSLQLYGEVPIGEVALAHYKHVEREKEAQDQELLAWRQLLNADLTYGIAQTLKPETPVFGLHLLRYVDQESKEAIVPRDRPPAARLQEEDMSQARLDLWFKRPVITLGMLTQSAVDVDADLADWPLPERVRTFLRVGASAVIGPWWPTSEEADRLFWPTFYDLLGRRVPLGEAIWRARLTVKTLLPHRPDWLAYALFGDPRARPYWPEPSEGYTTLECINPDEPLRIDKTYYFRVSIRNRPPAWYRDRLILAEHLPKEPRAVFLAPGLQLTEPGPVPLTAFGRTMVQATVGMKMQETGEFLLTVRLFDGEDRLQSLRLKLTVAEANAEEVEKEFEVVQVVD